MPGLYANSWRPSTAPQEHALVDAVAQTVGKALDPRAAARVAADDVARLRPRRHERVLDDLGNQVRRLPAPARRGGGAKRDQPFAVELGHRLRQAGGDALEVLGALRPDGRRDRPRLDDRDLDP